MKRIIYLEYIRTKNVLIYRFIFKLGCHELHFGQEKDSTTHFSSFLSIFKYILMYVKDNALKKCFKPIFIMLW